MKKALMGLLSISIVGLFGCGKKKETPIYFLGGEVDISSQLIGKDNVYTTYTYDEDGNYRPSRRLTTAYYEDGNGKEQVLEVFNRFKDNDWGKYLKYVYEYDIETKTEICTNYYFIPREQDWFNEFKSITKYNSDGNIDDINTYMYINYGDELKIFETYDYTYDDNSNLISIIHQKYQGADEVLEEEKIINTYDNNKLILSETFDRIVFKNEEYRKVKEIAYEYDNDLVISEKIKVYTDYVDRTKDEIITYKYNNGVLEEELSTLFLADSTEIESKTKKVYTYDNDNTIIKHYYLSFDNNWVYFGYEETV